MSANFSCDLTAPPTKLPHYWEHAVGSDHALTALRGDWQTRLRKTHDELGFRYVRFRGILNDDVGTLICEQGKLIYPFSIAIEFSILFLARSLSLFLMPVVNRDR
jgi:xylan 1,4-beta-xylosidase